MTVISVGIFGLAWQLSVGTLFNPALVPSPGETFATAWQMIQTGELGRHVYVSLTRVLVGYVFGCLLGVGLGAAIGRFRFFRELVEPIIELIRPISPVAVVPLAMMWFGIGEFAKFVIIVYATVVIVLLNTAAGVERTPIVRVRAARCLGASESQIFFRIVLPSAMPYVLTGMRVALGFCFMGIVAAELIGAREGIGFLIMNSLQLLQTNVLFVGLLALGVMGAAIDRIFRTILGRTTRRYMQTHSSI
jgi:ABC-type nitrate/sulfonate/bicarbonate transport system permease component